jgi:ribonucleoside-diphosphate reductase alpha chain
VFKVIEFIKKRDGKKVRFESNKVNVAIKKAFLSQSMPNDKSADSLTDQVVKVIGSKSYKDIPTVENIQDIVENVLILNGYTDTAKAYILYRQKHKEIREEETIEKIKENKLSVKKEDGSLVPFNSVIIKNKVSNLIDGLSFIDIDGIVTEVSKTVYDQILIEEIDKSILNAVTLKIENHYNYSYLASRLVLNKLYKMGLGCDFSSKELSSLYKNKFEGYIDNGIAEGLLNPKLKEFDFDKISEAIEGSRDRNFQFLGLQTINDRYLLRTRKEDKVFELPQWMLMRVAMGLSLLEEEKEKYAIKFYEVLSKMLVLSSTPTLFNSGTTHSQMSSCYVNSAEDSIAGIFKTYSDCAKLSKWAGGIGTDWTQIRAKNAKIHGTNGESQGVIPFLKIYNDIALAVNQGGKRRGAMAAYLDMWHKDVEEFLELKKNTGDERRRAHDIHTACMIPDLFMKRVKENGKWTLFSPETVPDLLNSYGKKFNEKYEAYESQDLRGAKSVNAVDLWRKLLTMLYETGHPWITFKDSINVRNPQDHVGIVRSSNLCTEITLNTSENETAVCNLASINLSKMIEGKELDEELIKDTVVTAIRMLDNVIDNNFYPIPEAKDANLKHRAIGLGVMGYQDALYQLRIHFDSDENIEFADKSMEMVSYYAIMGSSLLAKERGQYKSYKGSKWDRGIFPLDSVKLLEEERGMSIPISKESRMDWEELKKQVAENGMRNSNCMAIAPTATIANIAGTTPCVEPTFKNIYMKENLSGNFVVVNKYLIDTLYEQGIWDSDILTKIKINNGSILGIDEISADIRNRYKETFEIDPKWILGAAAHRAKWIDQSASTNIFIKTTSGKVINDLYFMAWELGLKTTYYLRTLAASQVTKTAIIEKESIVKEKKEIEIKEQVKVCSISDPDCESCQ